MPARKFGSMERSGSVPIVPTGHGRVFGMAGATVSNDAVAPVCPETVKRKSNGTLDVFAFAAMGLLLTGGCVLGFMAFHPGSNSSEVVQTWNGVKDMASIGANGDIGTAQFGDYNGSDDVVANALSDFNDDSNTDDSITDVAYIPNTETGESVEVSQTATVNTAGQNASLPSYYSAPMDRVINWDKITSTNPQTKCWLYVPNTNIDYPVLQELKLGDWYYLDHDFYGNATKSGSIVTAALPEGSNTDAHFMILGHNMRNLTMFGTLRNYKNAEFYRNNPYFYIYYPDRVEKWEVWSCYHTTDSDIIYDMPYDLGSVSFEKLVKQINQQKSYKTDIDNINKDVPIVTLSTCEKIDDTHKGRFVVNAVMADSKTY